MPDKAYFDHFYGTCKLDKCACLDNCANRGYNWVGTGCLNWVPFGASNYEELKEKIDVYRKSIKEKEEEARKKDQKK